MNSAFAGAIPENIEIGPFRAGHASLDLTRSDRIEEHLSISSAESLLPLITLKLQFPCWRHVRRVRFRRE